MNPHSQLTYLERLKLIFIEIVYTASFITAFTVSVYFSVAVRFVSFVGFAAFVTVAFISAGSTSAFKSAAAAAAFKSSSAAFVKSASSGLVESAAFIKTAFTFIEWLLFAFFIGTVWICKTNG